MDAARKHVGGITPRQCVRSAGLGKPGGGSSRRGDLAEIVVLDPEGNGVADQAGTADQILDLVGAKPEATGLDHRVGAADKAEVAVLVEADGVAAVDHRLVADEAREFRARPELLLGRLGPAPVAEADQGAAMDQFALLAGAGEALAGLIT